MSQQEFENENDYQDELAKRKEKAS